MSETVPSFSTGATLSLSSSSMETNPPLSSRSGVSQTTSASAITAPPQDSPILTSPASPASPSSSSSAHLSDKTGVIVGGVIGGIAVLAQLSGILAWIWMHHNRRNSEGREIPQAGWTSQTHPGENTAPKDHIFYEVDTLTPRAELEVSPIAELEPRSIAELEPSPIAELGRSTTLYRR